jgi:uroporphyrin-III C-methyltransferase/precorrin-2 dehydrogenase/sirohydrochlorin ferrochelatase
MHEATRQRVIWRKDSVPIEERRPLLLEALNRLYASTETDVISGPTASDRTANGGDPSEDEEIERRAGGRVSIVGAGPGDPGLLTRRAAARLRAADLVLYDALVDRRILKLARRAQRFFVGKRAGRHSLAQEDIHTVMIRAARRGRRVVRLKGGDPFVFGRGGEEALALLHAGVPFDVIPGVTSAVAGPALAGIPVTHRGTASAVLVVSGHDERAFRTLVGAIQPGEVTLVILMGSAHLARLAIILLESGWPGTIPAAVIADASRPTQQVDRTSLLALSAGQTSVSADGPAMLVVGEVAAMNLSAAAARADARHSATSK